MPQVLSWADVQRLVTFKTFYLGLIVLSVGVGLVIASVGIQSRGLHDIILSLGISLATSSVLSVISEAAIRLDIVGDIVQELRSTRAQQGGDYRLPFFRSRSTLDCNQVARDAAGELCICGLMANDILSPQSRNILRTRLEKEPQLKVRVLLLNPTSLESDLRGSSSAYSSVEVFKRRLATAVVDVLDFGLDVEHETGSANRFEVRLYDAPATLSLIADDRRAVVTPFVYHLTGGRSPYFECDKRVAPDVYAVYMDHFNRLWESGVEASPSSFEEG